jgi:hypothetical protein
MAWLAFDITGWLLYLAACCAWLVPLQQTAPAPLLQVVQEAR